MNQCCQPNVSQQILNLLCTWYAAIKAFLLDSPTIYSRQVGWNVPRVINSKRTRVEYYSFFNNTASEKYVKFYNVKLDTEVDPLTSIPFLRFLVPAHSGENITLCNILLDVGLVIRVTDGAPDTDVGVPADDTVIVNLGYKNLG